MRPPGRSARFTGRLLNGRLPDPGERTIVKREAEGPEGLKRKAARTEDRLRRAAPFFGRLGRRDPSADARELLAREPVHHAPASHERHHVHEPRRVGVHFAHNRSFGAVRVLLHGGQGRVGFIGRDDRD